MSETRVARTLVWVVAPALVLGLLGCTGDTETRARQAVQKVKESIPDVEAKALAQPVTPEEVKKAQEALRITKEYLGDADGKLDSVTVNAIEAFQRSRGITGDGMLNERTRHELQEAAASAQRAGS